MLRDLDDVLMPGITHWQSPRYFAYFATTGAEPGILAELLIAGLNQVGILWRASPALQELEEVTLDWLRQLLGLPEPLHGHIEDTRLVGADHRARRGPSRGARPARRRLLRAHALVDREGCAATRARRAADAGRRRVRACDPTRSTSTDACAVVATVGTTSSAAVDPVAAVADRAAAEGVWLHVDAAYAGAAAVCPELRHHFAGWERADSIGVNPHKWLSCRWTARPSSPAAPTTFVAPSASCRSTSASSEEVVSLSEYASPLGRRFRALKLWASLRCYGREGLQAIIREHVRLAALFEQWVADEPGWELCAPRRFSLVCFRLEGTRRAQPGADGARQRERRDLPLAHTARRTVRPPPRDRQRAHDRGGRRARVGRAPPRGRGCL